MIIRQSRRSEDYYAFLYELGTLVPSEWEIVEQSVSEL